MPHLSPSFVQTVIQHFLPFKNLFHILLVKLLAKRPFTDGLRSWRTGQAMHQANFLQSRMGLEVVDELVEVVGQSPYCASKYLS